MNLDEEMMACAWWWQVRITVENGIHWKYNKLW
jgi:hypothetical protein